MGRTSYTSTDRPVCPVAGAAGPCALVARVRVALVRRPPGRVGCCGLLPSHPLVGASAVGEPTNGLSAPYDALRAVHTLRLRGRPWPGAVPIASSTLPYTMAGVGSLGAALSRPAIGADRIPPSPDWCDGRRRVFTTSGQRQHRFRSVSKEPPSRPHSGGRRTKEQARAGSPKVLPVPRGNPCRAASAAVRENKWRIGITVRLRSRSRVIPHGLGRAKWIRSQHWKRCVKLSERSLLPPKSRNTANRNGC